ncbi:MAG TPA: M24 family metallopeptidase [Gemmatimonadaceae bacterium]|nr:M24 family metallopeptidase [Gemmatimonadaceae bacterium]
MLTSQSLPALQAALAEAKLDGWLLFDFHGINPIAGGLLQLEGMVTRRVFAWVPREGAPVAVTHAIEQGPWRRWPAEWGRERYSGWRALEATLARLVGGKRVAMEYSPGDAVPYLDRVPAGVLEMVRAAGAEVVTSGELVSRFFARLSDAHIASHERASEIVKRVAIEAIQLAGSRARGASPIHEHELMTWIMEEFARAGLIADHGEPIVAAGANAADPHYEPSAERPRAIIEGELLLIDLWAREPDGVFADQTWMASIGQPTARQREVWEAVRDARDAAIAAVVEQVASGDPVRGGDIDDVARGVITQRGFGEYFTHRTGHSIDPRDLHGSGPHIDNLETREERALVPGLAFSIEPGVYVAGDVGARSEVNAYLLPGRAVITPAEYQRELIVV